MNVPNHMESVKWAFPIIILISALMAGLGIFIFRVITSYSIHYTKLYDTIGDEILIGQIVDTNSAWMAEQLNLNGIEVFQVTSVHDDHGP